MKWAIEYCGEKIVVQIVTDSGANFKKIGQPWKKKTGSIVWSPCLAHSIELILMDVCKNVSFVDMLVAVGKRITRFIYGFPMLATIMKRFTGREIMLPGFTSLATHVMAIESLLKLRLRVKVFYDIKSVERF